MTHPDLTHSDRAAGLDANTYTTPESDQLGVRRFAEFFSAHMLNSCYGPDPNPHNFTTFHARTHLQAQLNKVHALSYIHTYIHRCICIQMYAHCFVSYLTVRCGIL